MGKLNTDILNEGDVALAKLFVKILCKRAMESETGGVKVGTVDSQLGLLETNEEGMSEDRLSDLSMIAEVVLDALPSTAHIEQEALEGYMCAEQCNSFGIWGETGKGQGKLLGFGIFPRLCMFNHRCYERKTSRVCPCLNVHCMPCILFPFSCVLDTSHMLRKRHDA